jgi:hypothetical protein
LRKEKKRKEFSCSSIKSIEFYFINNHKMRKSINYSISKIKIKFKKSIEKNDEPEQNFIFLNLNQW